MGAMKQGGCTWHPLIYPCAPTFRLTPPMAAIRVFDPYLLLLALSPGDKIDLLCRRVLPEPPWARALRCLAIGLYAIGPTIHA